MNDLFKITYYIQDIFTSLMISSSVIVSMRFLKFEDDAGDEFEIGKFFGFCFFGELRTRKGYFVELGAFLLW